MCRRPGFLVFQVILVPIVAVGQMASYKCQHPGTIINAYSHKGILADAHAYGSDSPNSGSTTCPVYSNLLDTQKSSSTTGAFIFHIDHQISGYIATYCEQGYAPRTETTNDNVADNTGVQPDPITLYPISLPGISSAKIATTAIGTDIDGLHASLSSYQKANPVAFNDALSSPGFSSQDRFIISAIMQERKSFSAQGAQSEGWQPQTSLENPKVVFVAMVGDLNHARSDLVYYARSDERGYLDALHSAFPVEEGKVIEEIRTRSEPFGHIQKSYSQPSRESRIDIQHSFTPSGWMGDGEFTEPKYIVFSEEDRTQPHTRPASIKISYAFGPKGWGGIYWQNLPDNWGDNQGSNYSRKGFSRVIFWARGENGNEVVEFKVGGIHNLAKRYRDSFEATLGQVRLSKEWTQYEIDLSDKNLSSVIGGFCWVASSNNNRSNQITFYLEEITLE